ncbi:MAG: glycosyltransferase family 39 protein, partial [Saprospiraceae bacterium]
MKPLLPLLLSFIAAILLALLAYYVPVHEWDESRNGINAIEMLGNGDWLNLHYAGKVDTWNAKPPLLIWCIALSFKIFGISVFALRIPSIICGALFIYFFYLTSRLFIKPSITIAITIGLIFTKIFYLDHIGFTADFDGMLNLIIIMATYFYFKFILTQQSKFLHFASLILGIGFWVKGPAIILFCIPVLIHYLITTYKSFNLKRSLI